MRTYGRVYAEDGSYTWVEVSTDANGFDDMVMLTTLAQVLKLNLGESPFYANFGIPELWVIHAVRLETRVHRKPSLTGYQSMLDLPSDQLLVPACSEELAVTLSNLQLN